MIKRDFFIGFLFIILFFPIFCSGKVTFRIEGLENKNLYHIIYKKLSNINLDVSDIDSQFFEKISFLIRDSLHSLGYYSSKINFFSY